MKPRSLIIAILLLITLVAMTWQLSVSHQKITRLNQRLEAAEQQIASLQTPKKPIAAAPILAPDALDLFGGEDTTSTKLDTLRPRYESALLTAYILHHCQQASTADLAAVQQKITQSLRAYHQTSNDTAEIEQFYQHITQSAEASYQMLYGHVACGDIRNLNEMAEKFQSFIKK